VHDPLLWLFAVDASILEEARDNVMSAAIIKNLRLM